MKKASIQFVCKDCGYESPKWMGKCPGCGEWNSMQEFKTSVNRKSLTVNRQQTVKPIRLSEVQASASTRISSSISEFDRVLGGGFVIGSVSLMAGEPGIGKSTLLLTLCQNISPVLYVCGEESPEQVKLRAERLGVKNAGLLLLPETNVENIIGQVGSEKWDVSREVGVGNGENNRTSHPRPNSHIPSTPFIIIDSIQTLWSEDFDGSPGSVSQVKGCCQKLLEFAKKNNITMIIVGHVNKEGEIAGPMMLSHMVDAVFFLEGERFADLRLLRGIKNRFGPTDEVGVFRMTEKGMEEVTNPSELFLGNMGNLGGVGRVTVCAMEGTRPMLLEVQALVTKSFTAIPRRVASGVDYNRVLLLTAVLQKTLNLLLYDQDIYVKVGGGFKIAEPAADLAICLAIISSFKEKSLPEKTCAFGEIGLLGEIRRVNGEEKREKEARRLGFESVIFSRTIRNLREAISTFSR